MFYPFTRSYFTYYVHSLKSLGLPLYVPEWLEDVIKPRFADFFSVKTRGFFTYVLAPFLTSISSVLSTYIFLHLSEQIVKNVNPLLYLPKTDSCSKLSCGWLCADMAAAHPSSGWGGPRLLHVPDQHGADEAGGRLSGRQRPARHWHAAHQQWRHCSGNIGDVTVQVMLVKSPFR